MLGPVFRTHDPEGDRLVAVKAFTLDITPEQAADLAAEFTRIVALGLEQSYLAIPVGSGVEDFVAYLASQYVAGESLDAAIRQYGPAPPGDASRLMTHIADALDAAARVGVFHGALHPRDILVTPGETHVTGLGVAKALERIGLHGPIRRPYVAPERESGEEWGAAADVFSLAAISYEVLTGRRALPGTENPLPGLADLPAHDAAALRELIEAALDPDPGRRPAHAAEFASGFTHALLAGGVAPAPGERPSRSRKPRTRAPKLPGLDDPLTAVAGQVAETVAAPVAPDEPAPLPAEPAIVQADAAAGEPAEPSGPPIRELTYEPIDEPLAGPPADAFVDPVDLSPADPGAPSEVEEAPFEATPLPPPVPQEEEAAEPPAPAAKPTPEARVRIRRRGLAPRPLEPVAPVEASPPIEPVAPIETGPPVEALASVDADSPIEPIAPVETGPPAEPVAMVENGPSAEAMAPVAGASASAAVLIEEDFASLAAAMELPGTDEGEAAVVPGPEANAGHVPGAPALVADAGGPDVLSLDLPAADDESATGTTGEASRRLERVEFSFTPEARGLAAAGFTPELQGLTEALAAPDPRPRRRTGEAEASAEDWWAPGALANESSVPRAIDPEAGKLPSRSSRPLDPGPFRAGPPAWRTRTGLVIGVGIGILAAVITAYVWWAGTSRPESILPPGTVADVSPMPAAAAPGPAPSVPTGSSAASPKSAAAPPAASTAVAARPKEPRPAPAAPVSAASTTAAPAAKAAAGDIRVQTTPPQADVFVDGERRGVTPRNLRGLPYGTYTIRVARQGYITEERQVTLDAQHPNVRVLVSLARGKGSAVPTPAPGTAARGRAADAPTPVITVTSVSFETRPPGAQVRFDGKVVGVAPMTLSPVTAGPHQVEFTLPGYIIWSKTVTVAAGQRVPVTASLERDTPR